jgi:hypothetical protein
MQLPAADFLTDALASLGTDGSAEVDEVLTSPILRPPGTERRPDPRFSFQSLPSTDFLDCGDAGGLATE